MTRRSDPNPAYWEQYGPFQHVKHELIRCYLNGWYPKLGTWARRVLYVDTHAGRGRYESGDPGSPVLALQTLLRHSYREKLLSASEFNFLFIERDPANLAALEAELSQLKPFPARVNVETSEGDAFERLSAILNELRRDRAQMAPAFLFVDPYGFKIPAGLLGDLMKAGRVELFINVMWRELDMLIQQRPAPSTPHAQTLDEIFGSSSWRTEVVGDGMDERLDRAIPLMARGIGAKWWTSAVRMVTGGQATRYVLLHLTNSDDGRDLMKECAWSVSPAGGFMVRRSDNPDQQFPRHYRSSEDFWCASDQEERRSLRRSLPISRRQDTVPVSDAVEESVSLFWMQCWRNPGEVSQTRRKSGACVAADEQPRRVSRQPWSTTSRAT